MDQVITATREAAHAAPAPAPRPHAVVLRDVSKDYCKGKVVVPVLRNLSLTIDKGEFVALMGASGSGKTTLLNLVGGLDRPSAGAIRVEGEEIDRLDRARLAQWRSRNVGFIFQFYNLLPALTAARNIELPLLIQPIPAADRAQRVENALRLVGLLDRRDHRPSELSGGQQQRVAIARALIADAKILLCDEPTGDLDAETGDNILDILQMLHEERGKTILLATHDPAAAARAGRTIRFEKPGLR
jgi:putative ABC transport system ATP-binding protein